MNPSMDRVAHRFSAAAPLYHAHNVLQRRTATHLLSTLSATGRVLDLGCGPGTDFSAFSGVKEVVGVDIAQGMLRTFKQNFAGYHALCGDAQNLPLQSASIDTLYSNIALQWCHHLPDVINDIHRVLAAEGKMHASIVSQHSLAQLSDLGLRVNQFHSTQAIKACFSASRWDQLEIDTRAITVHFDNLKALLQSIKGVGASGMSAADQLSLRPNTLRGRADWQRLLKRAELTRVAAGLPLTYNICFIKAVKSR